MWISTQDRDKLVNSDRVKNIFITITNFRYEIKADDITLGTYTSKNNAIEALDYIATSTSLDKKGIDMLIEENGKLLK